MSSYKKTVWTDKQGNHHWIVEGIVGEIHWIALPKKKKPEWTKEQIQFANMLLAIGYLIVLTLAFVDLLIIMMSFGVL